MFNLTVKINFHGGRFCSLSSSPKSFLPLLNQFTTSAANAPNPNSENSNQDSSVEIDLKNRFGIYLKDRYGYSSKRELKYSNNCSSKGGPDSVIAFLKKHNFNDSRISVIVRKWPLVFQYVPEASFSPKIKYFRDLGFSSSDIVKMLTLAPSLLGRSLEDQIMPCVDFIKCFLSSNKVFRSSISRSPSILGVNLQDALLPNIGFLREVGVPTSLIAEFLKIRPSGLSTDPERFRVIVEAVQNMDMNPQHKNFVIGIIVMREISIPFWKEKVALYKSWGWSENQLKDAFKSTPRIMAASKDKITRIHDLLINKIGCDRSLLITRPFILVFSFERKIAPRCAYYQVLMSNGLIEKGFNFIHMLTCPKCLFLAKYVRKNAMKDPKIFKVASELFPD